MTPIRMFAAPALLAVALASGGGLARAHDMGRPNMGDHGHGHETFDAGEPGSVKKPSRRVEIVAREQDGKMWFSPDRVEVKVGEQIEFVVKNEGELEHEFVVGSRIENAAHAKMMQAMPDMQHTDPNAVRVAPGKTERLVWKFSKPGSFEFACLVPGHYEAGMKGRIMVR